MDDTKTINDAILCCVTPNHDVASKLFNYISKRTIDSLSYLLEVYETYFNIELKEIKENVQHCSKLKSNPQLFFFHHALKSAIESQDPDYATAIIDHFKKYSSEDFSVKSSGVISYVNLDDKDWTVECAKISVDYNEDINSWSHNQTEKMFLNEIVSVTEDVFLIMKKLHPDLYHEILVHVNTIILSCDGKLIGPLGYPLFGGTSVSYHGALFMQIPSDYVFFKELILEHIVHEAAHIHLNSILAIDPLVLNDISELHTSSVRKDPRPIIGIYHAMFVSCRVLMAFDACRTVLDDTYMSKQHGVVQEQFNKAFATCESNAKLTKLGLAILENCREYVR